VSELYLAIIAAAVVVMAIIQVTAIVVAARAARRVGDAVSRLEQDVRPIVANLQTISADAARATASAAAQVQRAEQTVGLVLDRVEAVSARVEETLQTIQQGILAPARDGMAFLQTIRSIFSSFTRGGPPRPRPSAVTDDEDALFIG
jgi:hypothetical protein